MIRWGLNLGLAGVVAFGAPMIAPLHAMEELAASQSKDPVSRVGLNAGPNPLWTIPLSSLSATRERPVFSPSRRAPPPAVATAPPVPRAAAPPPKPKEPERPPLTVVGTVSSATEGMGIFLDQTTNNIIRLRIGENHTGWVLRSIRGREANFEKDQRTATLALPSPSSAQSPANPILAKAQAGATWLDGDGQQIAPPPGTMSQSIAASPGPPLVSVSAMGQAGATWTDGDGQQIAPPSGTMSQSIAASPGPPLGSTSASDQPGATWTDGDGQQIAPPARMSRSMAASPVTDSNLDQNVN
jgi:hypothetical protein